MYCGPVLDHLEARGLHFDYRVYGNHVLFENQNYSVKYYGFLISNERTLKNTIIIDCHVTTYCLNLENGIPISPFNGNPDKELIVLAKFLSMIFLINV